MPVHRINVSPRIAAYTLTVRAQSGVPVDSAAPVFTSGATATPIAENSGAGQVVYTAAATDASLPVTYSLKATGDHAAFSINASTGAVTLTANPNYEAKASYAFTVVATDAVGNASERPVTLAITNRDESAPTITSGATATPIAENSGAGQTIYTVTSTDAADYVGGATTYSLKPVGDYAAFSINGATGAVVLTANPDYESKSSYSFTVIATDAAGNASERAVTLAITDVEESVFAAHFAAGAKGVDYGTINGAFAAGRLWQDAARTTPVTAIGQPVGCVDDLSGAGIRAYQSTATKRPVLAQDSGGRKYLQFDGVDDGLQTDAFSLAAFDKFLLLAGFRCDSTAVRMLLEYSPNVNTSTGSFYYSVFEGVGCGFSIKPTIYSTGRYNTGAIAGATNYLAACAADFAGTTAATEFTQLRISGADSRGATTWAADMVGTLGSYPLYIGSRAGSTLFFGGRLYSLAIVATASNVPLGDIQAAEAAIAPHCGVTIA